jgi:hypothetical protein
MKSIIFWDMMPCSPLSVKRRFGGTRRQHLQQAPACLLVSCWTYFFDPEDGGDMFFRNVGWHSTDYTASYARRLYSNCILFMWPPSGWKNTANILGGFHLVINRTKCMERNRSMDRFSCCQNILEPAFGSSCMCGRRPLEPHGFWLNNSLLSNVEFHVIISGTSPTARLQFDIGIHVKVPWIFLLLCSKQEL